MSRVAAVQMASGPNVNANLLEAARLIKQAAEGGAKLVVLPENFAIMGMTEYDKVKIREADGSGPIQDFLAEQAARYDIWLVGGTIPLSAHDPDRINAACLVFDDKGNRVARYDKIHLFDVQITESNERYNESETIEPGNRIAVLDTPFGKLGLAVCYDLRFPGLFRRMSEEGAELFALPAAFTAITGKAHWDTLVRARAIENMCYMIAAAQGGYHANGRETYGHSMIVDPWGVALDSLSRGSGVVVADIDLGRLHDMRRSFPVLEHRKIACGLPQ
ncbi:MAG: carbon-nitrogen hydrolase family protein [Gammaproteobacteria bacterium]|nr:carbon-nitrogen hydrolase family protein [Gammaproteobacteria bacterium]MCW8840950.1 carbon-nitrogen hydrolase family protein [Gammaproteobacteria bacterium]MCW8958186.1 carbon-nitrogen hydrolase family protein [Gammaproteobacteria bacterium]MCW8973231.1 carbon-nitrogen hydrolase family protein [Gammaproteobacteria bacterium]MCW8991737.1 carbon-nitrogen hydrolase family protein [Gammaproteobacteria bacterium]